MSPACRPTEGQAIQPAGDQRVYLPTITRTAVPADTGLPGPTPTVPPGALDPTPPENPLKLIFIHHSTGQAWLEDSHGGLGLALRDNNYFVSDTNYGWGPGVIGDTTDIGHWYEWFGGGRDAAVLAALYSEGGQHSSYSRLRTDPGGDNEVIVFKSCYPNSALAGSAAAAPTDILSNPMRSQAAGSPTYTVEHAKGIYIDLLEYFASRTDKLFVVITAPPLRDGTYAQNARAFNNWLVNDWLDGYPHNNVAVFDFYNVLTTNGGNADTHDLDATTGNHHRYANGVIEHITDRDNDAQTGVLEYPTSDDHPSAAGDQKATGEFVPLLNIFVNRWRP
jgi:hypothetical protein